MSNTRPARGSEPSGPASPFAPFWEGIDAREIRMPCCKACGEFHWYPQPYCPVCRAAESEWRAVRPSGEVFTSTVVRRSLLAGAGPAPPFGIALVSLHDAPHCRLVVNTADPNGLPIGAPVDLIFAVDESGRTVPRAVLAPKRSGPDSTHQATPGSAP